MFKTILKLLVLTFMATVALELACFFLNVVFVEHGFRAIVRVTQKIYLPADSVCRSVLKNGFIKNTPWTWHKCNLVANLVIHWPVIMFLFLSIGRLASKKTERPPTPKSADELS